MLVKLPAANPFLRDPEARERMVFKSVASSSAIEGIQAPFRNLAPGTGKSATTTGARLNGKAR